MFQYIIQWLVYKKDPPLGNFPVLLAHSALTLVCCSMQYRMRICAEMLLMVLSYTTLGLCQAQSKDYLSVANYIHHLTQDDLSHVNVLIAGGQDDLANQVLQKLLIDGRTSMAIANFQLPISKRCCVTFYNK